MYGAENGKAECGDTIRRRIPSGPRRQEPLRHSEGECEPQDTANAVAFAVGEPQPIALAVPISLVQSLADPLGIPLIALSGGLVRGHGAWAFLD